MTFTERAEQLADAYEHVARVNHYMVGITETVTTQECDDAEQLMITRQNRLPPNLKRWHDIELALTLLAYHRDSLYRATSHWEKSA